MNIFSFSLLIFFNLLLTPLYLVFFLLCILVACIPLFPTRTALENLKERLGVQGIRARFFVARIFLNYVFYFFEAFFFNVLHISHYSFPKDYDLESVISEIHRIYAKEENRGLVFILGHMANVEMYVPPVVIAYQKKNKKRTHARDDEGSGPVETRLCALAQPSRVALLNKIMLWYREKQGLNVLWTDARLFHHMDKEISAGHAMVMLVDQKPKTGGLFLEFFGKYSAFPTAGLKFCLNRNMIVTYAAAKRIIPGWQRIFIRSGKNLHLGTPLSTTIPYTRGDDLLCAARLYEVEPTEQQSHMAPPSMVAEEMRYFVAWFEEQVRNNPTQWCWDYRKWSRTPKK